LPKDHCTNGTTPVAVRVLSSYLLAKRACCHGALSTGPRNHMIFSSIFPPTRQWTAWWHMKELRPIAEHSSLLVLHHQCRTQCFVCSTHYQTHLGDTPIIVYMLHWGHKLGASAASGNLAYRLQCSMHPAVASNTQRRKASKVKVSQK
jgi:hypothetical protein